MTDLVEKVAEAVLYEGYLLYPYTRSALKNQQRWNFGGVYPRPYSELTGGHDPWSMQTQCLLSGGPHTSLSVKLRFLQVIDRTVAEEVDGELCQVDEFRDAGQVYRSWEEATEHAVLVEDSDHFLHLSELLRSPARREIEIAAGSASEQLIGVSDGMPAATGALTRIWECLQAVVEVSAEEVRGDSPEAPLYRVTVTITNTTPWPETPAPLEAGGTEEPRREAALRRTLVSTHTILRVRDGDFISLLDPPDACREAAESCQNRKTWPVLVGESGKEHDTMLSSPIILYDYPQIAPETPGDLFDATEIDELLRISIMTLTDAEKQEMRETDPRAREILERTENLSPEELMSLHGAVRSLQTLRRVD